MAQNGKNHSAIFPILRVHRIDVILQRFALKPKPRKILKVLQSNTFKIFLVVRLIDNCCKNGE